MSPFVVSEFVTNLLTFSFSTLITCLCMRHFFLIQLQSWKSILKIPEMYTTLLKNRKIFWEKHFYRKNWALVSVCEKCFCTHADLAHKNFNKLVDLAISVSSPVKLYKKYQEI